MKTHLLISSSATELGKSVVIGIVGWTLLYMIYRLKNLKNIKNDIRKKTESNTKTKSIEKLNSKINQLTILKENNLIDDKDFKEKKDLINKEKNNIKIDYNLRNNKSYQLLKSGYDNGLINELQFNIKLNIIREKIINNTLVYNTAKTVVKNTDPIESVKKEFEKALTKDLEKKLRVYKNNTKYIPPKLVESSLDYTFIIWKGLLEKRIINGYLNFPIENVGLLLSEVSTKVFNDFYKNG